MHSALPVKKDISYLSGISARTSRPLVTVVTSTWILFTLGIVQETPSFVICDYFVQSLDHVLH